MSFTIKNNSNNINNSNSNSNSNNSNSNNSYRKYEITENMTPEDKNKLEIIHKTYKAQRQNINFEFNQYLIEKYCKFNSISSFWAIFSLLDKITDLSDPDTDLPNSIHALQTAEAIRKVYSNDKDWMPLVGLIHDMGKILYVNGNDADGTSKTTQWALVGDTFITGCPIPKNIVLAQYNNLNLDNKDSNNENSNNESKYTSGYGLSNCSVSFGHDEYMYRLLISNNHKMPKEAEYIVRYHSLYTWHSGTEYDYLEDEEDRKMKKIVKEFNNFDLYTKDDTLPIKWNNELIKYYSELVKKYISPLMQIKW